MRSRYCAFVATHDGYLLRTWHPTTRPRRVRFDGRQEWLRLHVLNRTGGGLLDADGTVEFRADYRADGLLGSQRENSRFVRHHGVWVYFGPVPTRTTEDRR